MVSVISMVHSFLLHSILLLVSCLFDHFATAFACTVSPHFAGRGRLFTPNEVGAFVIGINRDFETAAKKNCNRLSAVQSSFTHFRMRIPSDSQGGSSAGPLNTDATSPIGTTQFVAECNLPTAKGELGF